MSAAGVTAPGGRQVPQTMPPAPTAKNECGPTVSQRTHASNDGAYPATASERSRNASSTSVGSCALVASARRPPTSRWYCWTAGSRSSAANRSAVSSIAVPAV